jgi:Phenazine biosynthesis-like protein
MKIPYYHVDSFTDELFGGNPAGVCILADRLSEQAKVRPPKVAVELCRRRKTIVLLGMRRVDQNHADYVVWEMCRVDPLIEAAERVADQNERRILVRGNQQRMQFGGNMFAVARLIAGLTPAQADAIITAYPGKLRNLRLNHAPGSGCVAKAGIKDHGWAAVPDTVNMHTVAIHIYKNARGAILLCIAQAG